MKNVAIKEHHLYDKTFRRGKRSVGRYVAVYILRDFKAEKLKNAHPQKIYVNRLGLSVSKKIGGAVVRNRVKRILRAGLAEARGIAPLKTGYLIVIAARVGAHEANSHEIAQELISSFKKLDMYKQPKQSNQENDK